MHSDTHVYQTMLDVFGVSPHNCRPPSRAECSLWASKIFASYISLIYSYPEVVQVKQPSPLPHRCSVHGHCWCFLSSVRTLEGVCTLYCLWETSVQSVRAGLWLQEGEKTTTVFIHRCSACSSFNTEHRESGSVRSWKSVHRLKSHTAISFNHKPYLFVYIM